MPCKGRPWIASGGNRPPRASIEAPISVSGLMIRSMGRRESDSSPPIRVVNGWAARIPDNIRIVDPEFPASISPAGSASLGSRISAHCGNAGVPWALLDIKTAAAVQGVESAAKQRPAGFFLDSFASMITPANFDGRLDKIGDCDWIIEAVTENLEIKRN